jgi:hypothetical protein
MNFAAVLWSTNGNMPPARAGRNVGLRVLHDHTVGWWHLQSLRRQQEKRRTRLPARDVRTVQVNIENR